MKSAKTLFQESTKYPSYSQILLNPAFESACHAALMDLVESMPQTAADPSKAWDSHIQIVGARNVLERLGKLHIKDEPLKPVPHPTLNYELKSKGRKP